jgi:hypothetical protein
VLQIRIRWDLLADPDRHPGPADSEPDPYPFQPNIKLKLNILSKILKIVTLMMLTKKMKQSELALL